MPVHLLLLGHHLLGGAAGHAAVAGAASGHLASGMAQHVLSGPGHTLAAGTLAGYGAGTLAGHGAGTLAGHGAGTLAGHGAGTLAGHGSSHAAGTLTGHGASHASGTLTGHGASHAASTLTGHGASHAAGTLTGHGASHASGTLTGHGASHAAGTLSGHASGACYAAGGVHAGTCHTMPGHASHCTPTSHSGMDAHHHAGHATRDLHSMGGSGHGAHHSGQGVAEGGGGLGPSAEHDPMKKIREKFIKKVFKKLVRNHEENRLRTMPPASIMAPTTPVQYFPLEESQNLPQRPRKLFQKAGYSYSVGQGTEDGTGHTAGYRMVQGVGHGMEHAAGCGTGHGAGHGTGHTTAHGTGHGTGHATGHRTGHGTGHATGHGAGHGTGLGASQKAEKMATTLPSRTHRESGANGTGFRHTHTKAGISHNMPGHPSPPVNHSEGQPYLSTTTPTTAEQYSGQLPPLRRKPWQRRDRAGYSYSVPVTVSDEGLHQYRVYSEARFRAMAHGIHEAD